MIFLINFITAKGEKRKKKCFQNCVPSQTILKEPYTLSLVYITHFLLFHHISYSNVGIVAIASHPATKTLSLYMLREGHCNVNFLTTTRVNVRLVVRLMVFWRFHFRFCGFWMQLLLHASVPSLKPPHVTLAQPNISQNISLNYNKNVYENRGEGERYTSFWRVWNLEGHMYDLCIWVLHV